MLSPCYMSTILGTNNLNSAVVPLSNKQPNFDLFNLSFVFVQLLSLTLYREAFVAAKLRRLK